MQLQVLPLPPGGGGQFGMPMGAPAAPPEGGAPGGQVGAPQIVMIPVDALQGLPQGLPASVQLPGFT